MTYSAIWETLRDFRPPAPACLPDQYPDLTGKYAFVTGTSAGVGYQTAKLLLKQGATVILFNRNKSKTDAAIERLKHEIIAENSKFNDDSLSSNIISINGDLSDLTTIKPAITQFKSEHPEIKQLDIVILNAGVMHPPNGSISTQGYELQFGTNVIGHQLLITLIHDLILNSAENNGKPRVVWLSSLAHAWSPANGGLTWDFKDASKANTMLIYGQSKAANVLQAAHYSTLHKEEGIISVAAHPGYLFSELQRHYSFISKWISQFVGFDPIYGAYTELYAALSPDVTIADSGDYFGPWGNKRELRPDIAKARYDGTSEKLWKWVQDEIKEYS